MTLTFLKYINVFEKLKMKAVHIIVSGLVQGVGFRYFVVRKARQLGLNGFVRNKNEGDVEIVVEGNLGMLNQLIEELKVGPISSDVRSVKVEWIEPIGTFDGFDVQF